MRDKRQLWLAIVALVLVAGAAAWFFSTRKAVEPASRPVHTDFVISLAPPADAGATAPVSDDTVKAASAALVLVESSSGRGTGFFSAADIVTTSQDIVGRQKSVSVTLPDGRQMDVSVFATAAQPRLVQLRVPGSSASWLPPAPVRDARAGEGIARLTWAQAAERGTLKGLRRDQGVDVFDTSVVLHAEDEGAPVVDGTGRVLGVVSGHRLVGFDSARPYFR